MLKVQCALSLTRTVNKSTILKQPAKQWSRFLWMPAQRSLSEVHVMFCESYFIYLFLWPLNFYTWWTLSVNREVTTLMFSWSCLNYRDGPESDEIWHIFKPRPQTLCSHARTRQNIVILKKNLLSTDCCSTRVPGLVNFGLQTRHPRVILLFLKTNDMGE